VSSLEVSDEGYLARLASRGWCVFNVVGLRLRLGRPVWRRLGRELQRRNEQLERLIARHVDRNGQLGTRWWTRCRRSGWICLVELIELHRFIKLIELIELIELHRLIKLDELIKLEW